MVNLIFSPYWSPEWFRGADLVIELVCMVIAFIITLYSYHIFRFIGEKKFLYFSLAFFFISSAFFVRIAAYALNFFIFVPASQTPTHDLVRNLAHISVLRVLGTLIPIILFLAAFMVLISLNQKLKDKKLISLLFILSFISSLLGAFVHQSLYYLIAFILLVYITHYFYLNCKRKRTVNAKLIFTAFALFTLSQLAFTIAPLVKLAYVGAEIIQLVSFIILLTSFVLIIRKK